MNPETEAALKGNQDPFIFFLSIDGGVTYVPEIVTGDAVAARGSDASEAGHKWSAYHAETFRKNSEQMLASMTTAVEADNK